MQTSFMNQEQASAWIRDFTPESAKSLVHKSRVGAISQVIFAPFQFDVLKLGAIASTARQSGLSVCFIALDKEIVGIGFQSKHDCLTDGWPDFDGSIVGTKATVRDIEIDTDKTGPIEHPYITKKMKAEIADYLVQFSKGLIEDNELGITKMYVAGKISRNELYKLVDSLRNTLVEAIQNGKV